VPGVGEAGCSDASVLDDTTLVKGEKGEAADGAGTVGPDRAISFFLRQLGRATEERDDLEVGLAIFSDWGVNGGTQLR